MLLFSCFSAHSTIFPAVTCPGPVAQSRYMHLLDMFSPETPLAEELGNMISLKAFEQASTYWQPQVIIAVPPAHRSHFLDLRPRPFRIQTSSQIFSWSTSRRTTTTCTNAATTLVTIATVRTRFASSALPPSLTRTYSLTRLAPILAAAMQGVQRHEFRHQELPSTSLQ